MKYNDFIKIWLLILIVTFCFSYIMWGLIDTSMFLNYVIYGDQKNNVYWNRLYIFGVAVIFVYILIIYMYYMYLIIKKENTKLYNTLLRLQANPHFIFNCINTLADLIQENPVQAEYFTLKFSEIYRYVVNYMDKKTVPIYKEIIFVKDYCKLYEISSPHTTNVEISEELLKSRDMILPLAIQMLVQNAIKHNSHTKEEPLFIAIFRHNEYIVVRNEWKPIKTSFTTTKKGLPNLNKRYSQFGKKIFTSNNKNYFEVKLPIL